MVAGRLCSVRCAARTQHRRCWNEWPRALARREAAALTAARNELAAEMDIRRVIQFFFYEQWHALRRYCAQRSIRVVGDIAIFVDYDSADVWAHRDLFRLARTISSRKLFPACRPTPSAPPASAGAIRSTTGTRSGRAATTGGSTACAGRTQTCDYIRLDHFRGFEQFWEIPANEPTAVNGRWVDGPKDELFNKLRDVLGGLPFFAEDLGYITPEVHALRERHQIPGMAVLQFGFADAGAHVYLPHRLTPDRVVYTGTHDNDTTLGWWKSGVSESERRAIQAYVGPCEDGIHWAFIRLAQESVASLAVVPLQDVLGLGSEARLNTPSVSEGNFRWRYQPGSSDPRSGGKACSPRRSD